MDPALRSTSALLGRIEASTGQLIKRFENLISLANIDRVDRNTTALNALEIDVETAALVRGAEELTMLIRQMQEVWLFGQLNTVGQKDALQKTSEDVAAITEVLGKIVKQRDEEASNPGEPSEDNAPKDGS
ncbi:MAG: hypothetical protein M1820_004768 [Bogoriella megaspora]|nr:MAG: hypothetical protein M1820_004768 [Bogoriella megaspora]